jgi:prepilin-type N-terminal cleavage/methylation domain-containing protein
MKNKKGFTLIELLVVISIIGILATIILASLTRSRISAKDAVVMQSLNSYRTQVEIDFEGNYNGLCTSGNESLARIEEYIESKGGELFDCNSDTRDYVIAAVLPSGKEELLLSSFETQQAYAQDSNTSGKLNGYCINSRGSSKKISLEEFKLLPETIKVVNESKTGIVDNTTDPRTNGSIKAVGSVTTMLNPFCTLEEVESYLGGGQNNSPFKRVCYDLENPEYTKTGCINVIDGKPVDPQYCDKAGIEDIECEGDFDPLQYQAVCIGKVEPYLTGCAENDPKTGEPVKSVDKVFCKELEPAECSNILFAPHCINEKFSTGCAEIDEKGNPLKPVDAEACLKEGIDPSKENCAVIAPFAAHCINKEFDTGCVANDEKGNPLKPVDAEACLKEGIDPSKENCAVIAPFAAHCLNKEFDTGCVANDEKGNPLKPVDPAACVKEGIDPDIYECSPEGNFKFFCPSDDVPFQTGCVEIDEDEKYYQVDISFCEKAGAKPATDCDISDGYQYRCNPEIECILVDSGKTEVVDYDMCKKEGIEPISCDTKTYYAYVCKSEEPTSETGCAEFDNKGYPIAAVDYDLCKGLPEAQCR